MRYLRLIVGIAVFCILATIISNFWANAIRDTSPGLAFSLLSYVNTLDGIGLVAVVLFILFGQGQEPPEEHHEEHPQDKTGGDTGKPPSE